MRRNFYREWIEELYDAKEYEGFDLEGHFRHPQPPDPAGEPEIAHRGKVIDPAQPTHAGDLYYTGVSVSLLTLRPEICLLLIIGDPGWPGEEKREAERFERALKLGWEYAEGRIEHAELSPRHRLRLGPGLELVRSGSHLVSRRSTGPQCRRHLPGARGHADPRALDLLTWLTRSRVPLPAVLRHPRQRQQRRARPPRRESGLRLALHSL